MTLRKLVSIQYRAVVDRARANWAKAELPPEGWLRTVRKALGMTGAQVARRMGTTPSLVARTERSELSGGVTLKAMERIAQSMGCRFVYAVVPEAPILDVLRKRAAEQARVELLRSNTQMALEDQALSAEQLEREVERLSQDKLAEHSSRLWDDE